MVRRHQLTCRLSLMLEGSLVCWQLFFVLIKSLDLSFSLLTIHPAHKCFKRFTESYLLAFIDSK